MRVKLRTFENGFHLAIVVDGDGFRVAPAYAESVTLSALPGFTDSDCMHFLHIVNCDADCYEYGVAKVKFHADGRHEVGWTPPYDAEIERTARQASESQQG